LRGGMPREELKSRLGLQSAVFAAVVAELAKEFELTHQGSELALPWHRVEIDPASGGPAGRLLAILGSQPFAPPSLPEAMRDARARAGAPAARPPRCARGAGALRGAPRGAGAGGRAGGGGGEASVRPGPRRPPPNPPPPPERSPPPGGKKQGRHYYATLRER